MLQRDTPGRQLNLPHGDHMLHWLLGALTVAIFVNEPLSNLELLPRWAQALVLPVIVSFSVLGLSHPTRLAKPLIVLALMLPLIEMWVLVWPSNTAILVVAGVAATCFLLLTVALLREVFSPGTITMARIEGAIAVYLLIAVGFAVFYETIEVVSPGSFRGAARLIELNFGSSFLYFSLITQATVGYGDIVPIHSAARSLATLQAVIGQFYIAVLVSRLVSLELLDREKRQTAARARERAGIMRGADD